MDLVDYGCLELKREKLGHEWEHEHEHKHEHTPLIKFLGPTHKGWGIS